MADTGSAPVGGGGLLLSMWLKEAPVSWMTKGGWASTATGPVESGVDRRIGLPLPSDVEVSTLWSVFVGVAAKSF